MPIRTEEREVLRYFVQEEFNPGSSKQLLSYMDAKNLKGGYNPKSLTGAPSTDKETLSRLAKKDPLFAKILEWRAVQKIDSTYVAPNIARADEESRLHANFTHVPSTMRLSCVNPNLQNTPDDEDEESLALKFRKCIVSSPGCLLVEADYRGIEAVETGFFLNDPNYMRFAPYVHSYVLALHLGREIDTSWDDPKFFEALAAIKAEFSETKQYAATKRAVHLTNYGGTPMMMHKAHPELFKNLAEAQMWQGVYYAACPKLPEWHASLRTRAAAQHYLGGTDHPFRYKHWFWDVTAWDSRRNRKIPGSDWNRVVSFYPQSTAAGVLYEAVLRLMDPDSPFFVGDLYFGRTPFRALIHDSVLGEVPIPKLDLYVDRLTGSMGLPVPEQGNLTFGVDVKIGKDWGSMKPLKAVKEMIA